MRPQRRLDRGRATRRIDRAKGDVGTRSRHGSDGGYMQVSSEFNRNRRNHDRLIEVPAKSAVFLGIRIARHAAGLLGVFRRASVMMTATMSNLAVCLPIACRWVVMRMPGNARHGINRQQGDRQNGNGNSQAFEHGGRHQKVIASPTIVCGLTALSMQLNCIFMACKMRAVAVENCGYAAITA
jgi:hypothetical protein